MEERVGGDKFLISLVKPAIIPANIKFREKKKG
jgi:hypothetical protein